MDHGHPASGHDRGKDREGLHHPHHSQEQREKPLGFEEKNRYLTKLLAERGGRDAFTHLPGDLSILDDLLIVSVPEGEKLARDLRLPEPWAGVKLLVEETDATKLRRARDGSFRSVPPGIYRMRQ